MPLNAMRHNFITKVAAEGHCVHSVSEFSEPDTILGPVSGATGFILCVTGPVSGVTGVAGANLFPIYVLYMHVRIHILVQDCRSVRSCSAHKGWP